MHEIPINSKLFQEYIQKNGLFEKAREYLKEYFENCYKQDSDASLEDMRAYCEKVMKEYNFRLKTVAINKHFFYEPPRDYLWVCISIEDEKGSYFCQYKVFFDFPFAVFHIC